MEHEIDHPKIEENEEDQEHEEREVDILEFSLDDNEIQELILKLQLLQTSKEPIRFDVDDENELLINYENSEVDGE